MATLNAIMRTLIIGLSLTLLGNLFLIIVGSVGIEGELANVKTV